MVNINYYQTLIHHPVEIECNDGSILIGIIESVDQDNVYIQPFKSNETQRGQEDSRFFPGIGLPAFFGGFAGGLLGVGLGSIIGVRPFSPYGPYGAYGPGPYGPIPPYGPYYGPGQFY